MYKYNKLLKVYLSDLYLNVTKDIIMLIIIFNKNNAKEFNLINKNNILKLPIIDPNKILLNLTFLFKTILTASKSKKSKAKFKNNTKSR